MDGIEEARIQLSEIELLLSMFPSKEELIINDQLAFAELRDYVEGRANDPPSSRAQFTIQQRLESANENMVSMSSLY